jgi:hypothetical protein
MIAVRETKDGTLEPITGNPTLTRLDGKARAPLQVILHQSWTAEDRAAFGVHLVEPFTVPDGKLAVGAPRYEKHGSAVVEVIDVEDIPAPQPDTRTPAEKIADLASSIGVTLDEMRSVLIGGKS